MDAFLNNAGFTLLFCFVIIMFVLSLVVGIKFSNKLEKIDSISRSLIQINLILESFEDKIEKMEKRLQTLTDRVGYLEQRLFKTNGSSK